MCRSRLSSGFARLVVQLVAVLLLLATVARADDPENYRLAIGFYNKEQWKLAAENFETFLKSHGEHPKAENARFYFGLTLAKLEDFRKARDVLREFVKKHAKSKDVPIARYWVGHCSFHLGDYAVAEQELAAFAKDAPEHPLRQWALPYLADAELRQNKLTAAREHFQAALDAFPKGDLAEDAKFGLARSYELLKQPDEALRRYQEIAKDKSGLYAAEARLNLGGLHYDAGRYAEAATAYRSLLADFPKNPEAPLAQLNLGLALYQAGEYRPALREFEKASQSERHAAEAALWQGRSLKALAELNDAEAVLAAGYEKYRDTPVAEELLFHWADCEQRRGNLDRARELFLQVFDRWPKGSFAADSLHAACAAAIATQQLAEAESLLARFDERFPGNRLRLRQEILKGRLLTAKQDLPAAEKQFQKVITESEIDSTRQQARYYLADVLQKRNQHSQALEVTTPVTALWTAGTQGPGELAGVFVLRGISQLALAREAAQKTPVATDERNSRCAAAIDEAAKYLAIAPTGPLAPRALAIKTQACAIGGDKPRTQSALELLRQQAGAADEVDQTLYDLGSIAFSRGDFEWSAQLFGELAGRPKENRLHSRALADLGWSQYRQKKYPEATAAFGKLLTDHPQDELVSEAAFMKGKSLQDAGDQAAAQAAFAEAFARPGEAEHTFLAGLQAARLLVRLGKLGEADSVYTDLLKRFGQRMDADKVVDEWATAHYTAEDYSKADELFRRLATDYPQSSLADNARLSLAESDFIAGRLDEARREFASLAANVQADEVVQQRSLFQLMQIEVEARRWEDVRKVCQDSLTRFPEGTYHWDAEWRWAEADVQSGKQQSAIERLNRLKGAKGETGPRETSWFPQVWALLSEAHLQLKEHKEVAATVAELRELYPDSSAIYLADEVLGRSLKAQAMFPEARNAFLRVIENPHGRQTETAAKAQFYIADSYHFQEQFDAALREYLKVDILYKFPKWQAHALLGAGLCHENLEQWKDAARTYEDLLRNFPDSDDATKAKERLGQVKKRLAAS